MIVAITGGRDVHPNRDSLTAFVRWLGIVGAWLLVHGDCPTGVDRVVSQHVVRCTDLRTEPYPADWKRFGKFAGPRRNGLMLVRDRREFGGGLEGERVDVLVAWPGGPGTANCAEQAHALGIRVLVLGDVFRAVRASERVQA